jgi:glutamate dehydrogenase
MKNFSDILFNTVSSSDLDELSDYEKDRIVSTHKDMCSKRESGTPLVKISRTVQDNLADEKTVIDIVCNDHPFLLDSVVAEINRHNLLIDFLIHPYIYVTYGDDKKVTSISKTESEGAYRQSHISLRLQRLIPRSLEVKLKEGLKSVIFDVKLVTSEWQEMRYKTLECRDHLQLIAEQKKTSREFGEYAAFLEYMYDHNFTLLGYRYFKKVDEKKTTYAEQHKLSLGLLRKKRPEDFLGDYAHYFDKFLEQLEKKKKPLHIFKINQDSTVHRRVPVDAITIEHINKDGKVDGYHLFIGLFTSVTYSRSVADIPYLRLKIDEVLKKTDFPVDSHDDKTMRHILEKYPRDELFQIEIDQLYNNALSILRLQEKQRISLFLRPYLFGAAVACMVYIPRDRFETRMRLRFQRILESQLDGQTKAFYTTLDDSLFVRVILLIEFNEKNRTKLDEERLEKILQQAGRAWDELLEEEFNVNHSGNADHLIETYCGAFPVAYRESYAPEQGVKDVLNIEDLQESGKLQLDLYRPSDLQDNQLRLKIYAPDKPVVLSAILPLLENFGLQVISELPYKIELKNQQEETFVWIQDFLLEITHEADTIQMDKVKDKFEEAFKNIWEQKTASDSLNRLVFKANMNWREIFVLRTYTHYMRQLNHSFSPSYISSALTENPKMARLLVDLFCARMNPDTEENCEDLCDHYMDAINEEMASVELLDHDRILRGMWDVIAATLRTNFYQMDEDGNPKDYVSIKLDSKSISDLPDPKPYREIYVYSPRMEGIHLRGGPIARGGIRWSDRLEDYRTEVLGLMKAQMVKNALIVPSGAKGGFVVKNPPKKGGRQALQAEAIECYKILIRGLLDITDNRKKNRIIEPSHTVCHDDHDPYLVVAADKGTATFSDIANALSIDYGFWLGDAFASGGSAGYDHKVMGITARGAWESVKRHFAELNHDTQTQPFDVIGVGDMAGDVFGNGMLLSEEIRLIGAFNHLHIFCDPDPDTAKTFAERKRLFEEVRGWDAYDESLLSKGGRIYSRSSKSLELTPEIQQKFGLKKNKVSPLELIKAMLKARCDLLWFGGIGTYIKSTQESDLDVGDKSNDAVRINAYEVQAKVIGEGANLAITQEGRIEFASKGGRINADFIDNSGGVNSSDHEVNIKILLQSVVEDKSEKLNEAARNKLLESMTDSVAEHVLYDNMCQAEAISLMEFDAAENISIHADFIEELENRLNLDRELENLPSNEEMMDRKKRGKGLTRPEFSILQAYAKILITNEIQSSKIPDLSVTKSWLRDYFPDILRQKYEDHIHKHQLGREIIAMRMANNIVNRMGPTFITTQMTKTGAACEHIVRGYLIVRNVFGLSQLWKDINDEKFEVLAYVRLRALKYISHFAKQGTVWFVQNEKFGKDIQEARTFFKPGVQALQKDLLKYLPEKLQHHIQLQKDSYIEERFPPELAQKLALMPLMKSAFDIILITKKHEDLPLVARMYFMIGEFLMLDWLHEQSRHIDLHNRWDQEASDSISSNLYRLQAELTAKILKKSKLTADDYKKIDPEFLEDWLAKNMPQALRVVDRFKSFRNEGPFDLSILTLAEHDLRGLVSHS